MLSRLAYVSNFAFAQKAKKPKSAHQRLKYYSRFPDKFKLKTRIRPPDLTDPNITFPIRIPIRYRHEFYLRKELIVDNTSKIHWNRLQPNQILLAFQNSQYLSFNEVVQGLKYLSDVKGQEQHDWNQHQWVSNALHRVRDDFNRIKKVDIMNFYFLMKKLRYSDQEFWKKMYARIEQNIYDLHSQHFELIFIKYYDQFEQVFSAQARAKFNNLMEGRIRKFSPASIITIFDHFMKEQRLDTYWLESVFISLFKEDQYKYSPEHIGKIFRSMMILNHEENERLYDSLYKRIAKLQFKSKEEIEDLEEVLLEVKELFTSHRVEPSLEYLRQKKGQVIVQKVEAKKTIEQMVRDDLKYFLQKRKLRQENATQYVE